MYVIIMMGDDDGEGELIAALLYKLIMVSDRVKSGIVKYWKGIIFPIRNIWRKLK